MASDEKILQYKDLKNYNNRVKQYVDENAGSGGSTTLADLGVTVTAAQINEIPSIKAYAETAYSYSPYRCVNSVTIPAGSTNYSTKISTGLSRSTMIRSGYIIGSVASVSYYQNGSYWYADIQFHNSVSSPFEGTCQLVTYYNDNR